MAIALAHQAELDSAAGAASNAITVTSTTAGNALVVVAWQAAGGTALTFTVSDNIDGTTGWSVPGVIAVDGPPPADETSGANSSVAIAYKLNVPSGITTVTVTWSAAGKQNSLNASEWSGVATATATDGSLHGGGAVAATTHATPAVTTTNANDLVIAAIEAPTSPITFVAASSSPTTGWTELTQGTQGGNKGGAAYNIASATGTYGAAWTTATSVKWGGVTLALKAAAAGAATVSQLAALGVG